MISIEIITAEIFYHCMGTNYMHWQIYIAIFVSKKYALIYVLRVE